jgi:hypothetical protein
MWRLTGNGSRHGRLSVSLALSLVFVGAAAACGDEGGNGATATSGAATPTLPDCAPGESATALPDGFPAELPLPPGTVVTRAEDDGTTMNVEALVPGEIRAGAQSLLEELPKAGFELGEGDSEEHEAESHFTGHGLAGFFKLNTIGDCPGVNTLALVLTRT